ncbi:MAG: amidase [Reyranella sp.]|uniref:amidase n=1 Tax=Reyranella sp. TaxID=1929291 RepID=UPI0025FC4A03|nr:amidase family protein [Reyranella sp.]MBR2816333.1 amidase [Reyranella sp.]
MSKEELVSLSAVEMRRRIGTKEISPVELLEACLERIEEVNPAVNAVTAMCVARARKEAKAAEAAVRRGEELPLLHGLPTGIKDLEETKDLLTTYGSPLYRDYVPNYDNVMVDRVRASGAIVVGKTNVPEFGAGSNSRNPVWGATGNPFNTTLNAGGSSGGSAAALATDLLPVCTGSDTGGSLRNPAAYCGIVGFRPSPGMVAVERRAMGWTPISVLGPMGRTVADTCLLYATQIGQHDQDPLSFPIDGAAFAEPWPVDLGSLRVAWTEDFGGAPVEKGIRATMREKMKAMKPLFRSLDKVEIDYGEADRCFDVIRAVSFLSRYHDAYTNKRHLLGPNIVANYEIGAKLSLADFAWAHGEETRIFRKFQELYRDYDLVLGPTVGFSPFPWKQLYIDQMDGKKLRNYYHWMASVYFVSLATNPAVSLPCGLDHKKMPFGLQVIGRFRGDGEVLGAAHAMEQAFKTNPNLARPLPNIAKLRKPTPALKSIVTHPPKLNAKVSKGPAPGAL